MEGAKAKKTDPAEIYKKAQEAFLNYDFDTAEELLDEYEAAIAKAKSSREEGLEDLKRRLNIAVNSFSRVQKIAVIDSINIPRASFFNAYKLMPSAGQIGRASNFKLDAGAKTKEVGFLNEDGDYFIVPVPNKEGVLELKGYRKLLDGSWESQDVLEEDFEKTGDYSYPFLASDGQTFYFANNGEDSMGGYDIFVAQLEPISGESLQPLNIGMPFNSPYDDFMMVMDEEKGLGWWATDRNSPGGDVTVYVYMLTDIRQNYRSDEDNLTDLAKISSYKSTWQEGKEKEYQAIIKSLK